MESTTMEDSQASSLKEQYSDPSNSHTKRRSILENELFIERLETLYEKELTDLHAFAQREGCPFEEVGDECIYYATIIHECDISTG